MLKNVTVTDAVKTRAQVKARAPFLYRRYSNHSFPAVISAQLYCVMYSP